MSERSNVGGAAGAASVTFAAAGGWCSGWHHPAAGERRSVGVVLCQPLGYEAICAHRTYALLAQGLAQDGFDVLRFDYHGTGDSSGCDGDPQRVQAWLDSIAAGALELRRTSTVARIVLFGVRLGATLATRAACTLGGVDGLVLWAPCSGRAFGRELRAANAARGQAPGADGEIEALGYRYTAATLQDLAALDRQPYPVTPAARALVIARDDMPADESWASTLGELGVAVTSVNWRGYAAMMVEPHEAVIALDTLAAVREWLGSAPVVARPRPDAALAHSEPPQRVVDGVQETPLAFGHDGGLFGILSEPASAQRSARWDTAVLLLSIGANPHFGPSRNYVRCARALAAAGYRALRIDLRCIGDSRGVANFCSTTLYSARNSVADVRAAIDCLAERGCTRFYLMGICSGSYAAFQTSLVDQRVTGQILMNSRLLDWERGKGEDSVEQTMHTHYKSSGYYLRSLLDPSVYWRVVRGDVDVSGIGGRFASLFGARAKRLLERVLRRQARDRGLLGRFRQLSARGIDTLMIMAEEDDGRDYVEFHLGPRAAHLADDPNFRLVLVPHADHTFSSARSQQAMIDVVREHLDRRMAEPTGPTDVFMRRTAFRAG